MQDTGFKPLRRTEVTAAFALAHRMSERCTIPEYQKHFRKIAVLLWQAAGEGEKMPKELPDSLEQLANQAAGPNFAKGGN